LALFFVGINKTRDMENNKSDTNTSNEKDSQEESKNQQPLTLHNPLNPDDPRKITQEDIENEQKYKEALTERD
jgi:hypothetical protein